jgi:hypothetical protein
MKFLIVILIFINTYYCVAQNKSGNNFVFGSGCMLASFSDTSRPTVMQKWPANNPKQWYIKGHSMISDSASGKPVFYCNGFILHDIFGNVIENGDSLVPNFWYNYSPPPCSDVDQASLILPKGSNGQYYVFTVTNSDSFINYLLNSGINSFPYNLLEYHVVDMNANNGAGKLIQKHVPLITNKKLSRTGMQACRHANGYDWWLVKQASYDSNYVYRWLIKSDTIIGPRVQVINGIVTGWDIPGQSTFSTNGKQYAYGSNRSSEVFIADFNRCTGLLSNSKIIKAPIDSTGDPFHDNVNDFDSLVCGVAFSPNDSFLYVAKRYNIYQYDLYANTWYRIAKLDTTLQKFEFYGNMQRGVDGRIYIGKYGATYNQNSVIDFPNKKGVACGWCPKCLRYNLPNVWATSSPSNMPDFMLGADSSCYWPLASGKLLVVSGELKVYPNPANNIINIEGIFNQNDKLEIYNAIGQKVLEKNINPNCTKLRINIEALPRGLYVVKVKNGVVRFLKE